MSELSATATVQDLQDTSQRRGYDCYVSVGIPHGKPVLVRRILDLFCKAGGAAMGLHRAFPEAEIVGVDIKSQKRYPFRFVQADAMEFDLDGYDFIWASPPCQGYSVTKSVYKREHPKLIPAVRKRLKASGAWYIIENVPGAPLQNPITLCGTMFGLNTIRHRIFECNPEIHFPPFTCNHWKKVVRAGREPGNHEFHSVVGHHSGVAKAREAMGIDWMTQNELAEAVPPAYSEWLGKACRAIISTNGT